MSKVTIIIPTRNELYLSQTVDDIFAKARGDIEVIVSLDNYWPNPILADRPNLTIIHWGKRVGMRACINAGVELAHGDYIMKVDAHCMFQEGFDLALAADCDDDWIVVPRRYGLDSEAWQVRTDKPEKYPVDYEYLEYPSRDKHKFGMHGKEWTARREARKDIDLDENMIFQGSCWFMPTRYFMELCYPMEQSPYGVMGEKSIYGTFTNEAEEIGLKCWLSGGRVMTNKKTWYAHLYKGQGYRDKYLAVMGEKYYRLSSKELFEGNARATDYWFYNRWERRIHDLSWLIERFAPVPTWPTERELWTNLRTS